MNMHTKHLDDDKNVYLDIYYNSVLRDISCWRVCCCTFTFSNRRDFFFSVNSAKFSSKIKYVHSLDELQEIIPMDCVQIPECIIKWVPLSP